MDKIEDVKNLDWLYNPHAKPAKELSKHDQRMIELGWNAACQLFEPKPDEGRLLTDEEYQSTFQREISVQGGGFWIPEKIAELQDAKTASIKDAECQAKIEQTVKDDADRCAGYLKLAREECQQRIKRIFREFEKYDDIKTHTHKEASAKYDRWQALKKQEGIE